MFFLLLARRGTSRAASLIADQITAAANRTNPVGSQPAAVGEALPHDRVALLLRGAASAHSANADRANLRAASLSNLVRDDSGLAGLLSEGGRHGQDRNHGGCEQVKVSFSLEHGVIPPRLPSWHECYALSRYDL
jgi:hypothetical protein